LSLLPQGHDTHFSITNQLLNSVHGRLAIHNVVNFFRRHSFFDFIRNEML
jgi:hypothetical protein